MSVLPPYGAYQRPALRLRGAVALLALGLALAGCAEMTDTASLAFADPARYDLYDCKQLEAERKRLSAASAELNGLIAKAETGTAGPVVAEMVYRNDLIAVRGQSRLAEQAWQRNRCRETLPGAAMPVTPAAPSQPAPLSRAGRAVY